MRESFSIVWNGFRLQTVVETWSPAARRLFLAVFPFSSIKSQFFRRAAGFSTKNRFLFPKHVVGLTMNINYGEKSGLDSGWWTEFKPIWLFLTNEWSRLGKTLAWELSKPQNTSKSKAQSGRNCGETSLQHHHLFRCFFKHTEAPFLSIQKLIYS